MSKTLPSYTSGTAEVPLLGMTIGEMLDRTAEKYPDNDQIIINNRNVPRHNSFYSTDLVGSRKSER